MASAAGQFLIFSKPGVCSVIVARLTADSSPLAETAPHDDSLAYAGICVAAPAETISGDAWACRRDGTRASMTVAMAIDRVTSVKAVDLVDDGRLDVGALAAERPRALAIPRSLQHALLSTDIGALLAIGCDVAFYDESTAALSLTADRRRGPRASLRRRFRVVVLPLARHARSAPSTARSAGHASSPDVPAGPFPTG